MLKKEHWSYKPIILIGVPRSGTTLFGSLLANHEDVCYWVEPKYIWKYPKPDPEEDVILPCEVNQKHINYIRLKFSNFSRRNKKHYFLEKTPSNCFRIGMIRKVFPDAKTVVLLRRSPDVVKSLIKKWTESHDSSAYIRRLNPYEFPIRQIPRYFVHFLRQFVNYNLRVDDMTRKRWGPMTKELRDALLAYPVNEICAMQYILCMESILKNLSDKDLIVDYDKLIQQPQRELKRVTAHIGLDGDGMDYNSVAREVDSSNHSKFDYESLKLPDDAILRLRKIDLKIDRLVAKSYSMN
jgi:hypothetical protein